MRRRKRSEATRGPSLASTAFGPDAPYFGDIPIQIVGTAGEAAGAPVNLTITPRAAFNGNPNTTNFVNGNPYSLSTSSVISSLKVGDTFKYWLSMAGPGSVSGDLTVTLDVASAMGTTPVPEPASGALLFWALLAGGALFRRTTGRKIV